MSGWLSAIFSSDRDENDNWDPKISANEEIHLKSEKTHAIMCEQRVVENG